MKPYAFPVELPRGALMVDVAGLTLDDEERKCLCDPRVGGVILFARNYADSAQLRALTGEIRALRSPSLIIGVDHEGGRVQRFRTDGFTRLPAMRALGELAMRKGTDAAIEVARAVGYVLASELAAHGVDMSFTPVLDLDYGCSRAIGSRAFHRDPVTVADLALSLVAGMKEVGMGAVGKHFPGHGCVEADSHHEIPHDGRPFEMIWDEDMVPYRHGLLHQLAGVMPAHVVYPNAEPGQAMPAGFSDFWLKNVLRARLDFRGIVFSDDLNMAGATLVAGDVVERVKAAARAGCDMWLVCNRPDLVDELLRRGMPDPDHISLTRIAAMPMPAPRPWLADPSALARYMPYQQAREMVLEVLAMESKDDFVMTAEVIGATRTNG